MRFGIFSVADHSPEEPRTIRELYAQILDETELETAGLILFGDAEQVSSRIRELEAAGMNHLMSLVDLGALQAERVRASLKRFAREVMPNFVESGSISASKIIPGRKRSICDAQGLTIGGGVGLQADK